MDICPNCYGMKEWQGQDCPMCWGKGVLEGCIEDEAGIDLGLVIVLALGLLFWVAVGLILL